jgi:hypothetical protein
MLDAKGLIFYGKAYQHAGVGRRGPCRPTALRYLLMFNRKLWVQKKF